MKILVTGGTGVIGAGLIPRLLERGHDVRLLSRNAKKDVAQWEGVEPFEGNVADAASLHGAASDCDAVIHVAGIATEEPPERTFAKINVEGTRNVVAEAKRAGAKRFIVISSLGADRGESEYHQSKREAERIVEASALDWTIVRPGNLYGPGDEVISTILKMVRALPVVPMIDLGDQPFQPIWFEDLGEALVQIVERPELARRVLDVSGTETTTMNDVIRLLREITDRSPLPVPIPMKIAEWAAKIASLGSVSLPIDENKLTMLREKNVIEGANALEELGIIATPLEKGLRALCDALPEVLPEDGVGSLQHKRFWADIRGSRRGAAALMMLFRDRVNEIMPIDFAAEPGAPTRIEPGAVMTGHLPLRGNFQVRVEVVEPTRVVFGTIEGHPLAGIVQFTTSESGDAVRFAVDVYARASNVFDWIAAHTLGGPAQSANWRTVVQRMIDASGGTSDGVESEVRTLDDDEAARVEKSVRGMVQERQREESGVRRP